MTTPSAQTVTADLVTRLRHVGKICGYDIKPLFEEAGGEIERLTTDLAAASARIGELEKENFALAANQCHAGYGDEYGNHRCEKIEALKDALRPFVDRTAQPISQMTKTINKKLDGLEPVALVVTKDQFSAASAALSQTEEGR